ncbi:hypothetical protein A2U01_0025124, partial [Trifolium medium]|nr:hypothetical protein [Trifolium medium]
TNAYTDVAKDNLVTFQRARSETIVLPSRLRIPVQHCSYKSHYMDQPKGRFCQV